MRRTLVIQQPPTKFALVGDRMQIYYQFQMVRRFQPGWHKMGESSLLKVSF
jgi:hypothetical protein